MKYSLPLIILTGLLFGQDVLHLKSGESFEGTFYGKLGSDLLFKEAGDINTKKFPINGVEIIETNNGELSYPFEIPKVTSYDYKITIEYQALSFEEKARYDARETYKIFLNTDVVNYPDGLNNEEKTLYRKYYVEEVKRLEDFKQKHFIYILIIVVIIFFSGLNHMSNSVGTSYPFDLIHY
jgi:hypothetical protein